MRFFSDSLGNPDDDADLSYANNVLGADVCDINEDGKKSEDLSQGIRGQQHLELKPAKAWSSQRIISAIIWGKYSE